MYSLKLFTTYIFSIGCLILSCATSKLAPTPEAIEPPLAYQTISIEQELETKYLRMLAHVRNTAEEEILEVIYKRALEMRQNGQNEDVNMEDLMAHALQEAKILIGRFANNEPLPDNARGSTL